jgi:hypothetical protein
MIPKAAVNLTMSVGVNESPGFPPIVPRIPEIDFINVTGFIFFSGANLIEAAKAANKFFRVV